MREISAEEYTAAVVDGSLKMPVVLDIWDPTWPPCISLAPKFAELAARYGDRIVFMKMNRGENREIMKMLKLRGVPTIIFMDKKEEFAPRLVGDSGAVPEKIEATITSFLKI